MDNNNFNNNGYNDGNNNFNNNGYNAGSTYNYGMDANQTGSNGYPNYQDNSSVNLNKDANTTNHGTNNVERDPFQNYGYTDTYNVPVNNASGTGKAFSIVSLVCGITTVAVFCIPCLCLLCWVTGPVSIIFGILGLKKGGSKGMCIAGIICGSVGFLLYIGVMIYNSILIKNGALNNFYNNLNF